ncbi:uncharacterized protein LOC130672995 [Microplitis mediator]|uniref:uncharacterized protein LOC130672995 n=1 Tax=Microplitis mediator TaxID=375433 RepID=UPI002554E17E|nr:uncharacterized protein LOC130672995 [Microplitis mediator]
MSDDGSQFVSKELTSLLKKYGIEHFRTLLYSSQCNPGERANKVIGTMITQYIKKNHRFWDKFTPELIFVINTAKHESTQFTLAYLNYGHELLPPNTLRKRLESGHTVNNYDYQENLKNLHEAMDLVRLNLARALSNQSRYSNEKRSDWVPRVEDLVETCEHHLSSTIDKFSGKLANKYTGGYTVIRSIGKNVFKIGHGAEAHIVQVKDLKPCTIREIPVIDIEDMVVEINRRYKHHR